MGKNSRMQNHINEIKRKTQYFWSHKGKRFCAAMLCASMVMGNAGSIANASNVIVSGESSLATPSNTVDTATPSNGNELHRFQLTGEELYEALQNAIAGDARADVEFTGGSSAEYEDFFLEPGDYYELNLENGKKGNRTELRIFARIEESELVEGERDDYVIDGTEELMLLAVNRSEKDQKVTVAVDEKHTPEFVIPVNVKSDAELITSPSPVIDTTKTGEEAETATPSNGMPATPSDSEEVETEIPEEKPADELEGEIYELTSVEEGTAVGFLTTTGSLGLDDMSLIATDSNALTRYSMPVDGAENILVDVTAKRGTIPEGAELRARYLTEDGNEYQDVKNALDEANEEYGGMMALDIGFWLNDEEIEPEPGSEVQVKIRMDANLLPDDVDVGTLKVQHHAETDQGIRIETVAKAVTVEEDETAAVPMTMSLMSLNADAVPLEEEILDDVIIEEADPENPVETIMDTVNAEPGTLKVIETDGEAAVVETAFVVDGFSYFTITYGKKSKKVHLVDTNGQPVKGASDTELGKYQVTYQTWTSIETIADEFVKETDGYLFQSAHVGSSQGEELKWICYYNSDRGWRYSNQSQRPDNDERETSLENNIYIVYEKVDTTPAKTVETVDITGKIKVNLFNYDADDVNFDDGVFHFYDGSYGNTENYPWNTYTNGVVRNVVEAQLSNGYPKLTSTKATNRNLSYLFNTDNNRAVESYADTGSIFLKSEYDESGYYYYNAAENFAKYNRDTNDFTVYNKPTEYKAKFLPFNSMNADGQITNSADYLFGMTVEAKFIQPKKGQAIWTKPDGTITQDDMIFEFDGDDDVWVFIDDVLVLDLGALHASAAGHINFATGEVQVDNNGKNTAFDAEDLYSIMQAAGKSTQWLNENFQTLENGKRIFKDYTDHTFKFFYLERGRGESNCKIRFNLQTIPAGTINFKKNLEYANVQYAEDLDFTFKTFIDYDGEGGNYEVYKGHYYIYDITKPNVPIAGEIAENGIINLKHNQSAQLDDEAILDTSRFYIQEIGATSDKYEVSIDGVRVDVVDKNGNIVPSGSTSGEGFAAQTGDMLVSENPYIEFNNKVAADNQFNLKIEKKMADGQTSDDSYTIHVKLGGVPYSGKYFWYQNDTEIYNTERTAENGNIVLKAGEHAVIQGLVGGTKIEITENSPGADYFAPTYELVKDSPAEQVESGTDSICVIAKEGKELGKSPVVSIRVTNKKKVRDLTVKKVVDGQLGDRDKAFEFVIKNANQNPSSGGWHYKKSDGTTGTIPADGKFTLKHNEEIMITGLPTDQSILIEETDYSAEGYRTFYSTDENGNFQESRSYTYETDSQSKKVIFKNNKPLIVPTGIFTDNLPYLMMLAMAAIGLTGFSWRKKRVKKSRDDD